jgi:hypothetical protein
LQTFAALLPLFRRIYFFPSDWYAFSYIKELADRVTTLERERQANGLDGNSPQPTGPALNQEDLNFLSGVADATFPATPAVTGQKRSHSLSEGFNDQYSSRERGGVPPEELVTIDENDFSS